MRNAAAFRRFLINFARLNNIPNAFDVHFDMVIYTNSHNTTVTLYDYPVSNYLSTYWRIVSI